MMKCPIDLPHRFSYNQVKATARVVQEWVQILMGNKLFTRSGVYR